MNKLTDLRTKIEKLQTDLSLAQTDANYSKIKLALKLAQTELEAEVETQQEATEREAQLAQSRKKAAAQHRFDDNVKKVEEGLKALPSLEAKMLSSLDAAYSAMLEAYKMGASIVDAATQLESEKTLLEKPNYEDIPYHYRSIPFTEGLAPVERNTFFEFMSKWYLFARDTLQQKRERGDTLQVETIGTWCLDYPSIVGRL